MKIKKIISGGQTGVDRAALDIGLALGIPCGGWCPKGRMAEDGPIDSRYPLKETASTDYRSGTEKNVKESDGTLVLKLGQPAIGTDLIKKFAEKHKKPYLLKELSEGVSRNTVWKWIEEKKIEILNVTGPWESEAPGVYERTVDFLWWMLYAPKVRQRTKKSIVMISGLIRLKKGILTQKEGVDTIRLKVTIPPSDWRKLWNYCLNNIGDFGKQFWSNFIYPTTMELETKKGARGRYKESKHLVNWLKSDASFLYAYFTYWDNKPVGEWPDFLQRLLNKIREDEAYSFYVLGKGAKGIFKTMAGTKRPYRLTRYCIEKIYGEAIRSQRIKLFDNPDNFYRTYIQESASKVRKFFITGKSPQEIVKLGYQNPLKFIFESLKIL